MNQTRNAGLARVRMRSGDKPNPSITLNAICPYYTMYPLEFPLGALRELGASDWVLDPFCGRGTTNYAARLVGVPSIGFDSSPIAVAITRYKLLRVTPENVIREAETILQMKGPDHEVPDTAFWRWAYHPETLGELCHLRAALLQRSRSPARLVLRAIILGALHGPRTRGRPSYLSNQSPRTFAPKPDYAVRFWRHRQLRPPRVAVLDIVKRRADHYLRDQPAAVCGLVRLADSRQLNSFMFDQRVALVITSPPYYGMRTYIPDQWLRSWFLGGPAHVNYRQPKKELSHHSATAFTDQLRSVWRNAAAVARTDARLICRFGGITDRRQDPIELLKASFQDSGWRLQTTRSAGSGGCPARC